MKDERVLAFCIKSLNNQIRRLLDRSAISGNDANLTGMQYAFLGFIGESGQKGNVFQRDIEAEFNIRRSTASSMVRQLEKSGYIRREGVPDDARLKRMLVTEKAVELDKIARRNVKALQERLTSGISEREMKQFYETLDKIQQNAQD